MNIKEYIRILREEGCDDSLIEHSIAVLGLSVYIASRAILNGHDIDLDLIVAGALLHDIGRSKTHSVKHGYVGAQIIRERGLGEKIALIAERHVGAGLSANEAKMLGLPVKDYIPQTLEEKIVCYADKLVFRKRIGTIKDVIEYFKRELGENHPAVNRFIELDIEIRKLIGGKAII